MATFIIAEAGVNHNGSLDRAIAMIDVAADAGADAVKFQTFRADRLVTRNAPKAPYQIEMTGAEQSQHEMLLALELDEAQHRALISHAAKRGIKFLSTPFDEQSADLLASLGLDRIKLGSGEVTNIPLLQHLTRIGLPVILSTGMSTLDEVADAVAALKGLPVSLMHCVTSYPAPADESNLRAMATMREKFGLPVGWSDHTIGIHIAVAAVAMGASSIEKHFTLDRTLPGPDHAASLEPDELKQMVQNIRAVEAALGNGVKQPAACEAANRGIVRKSIAALRDIAAGETLTTDNIGTRRPATGMPPAQFATTLGRKAARGIPEGTLLTPDMLS